MTSAFVWTTKGLRIHITDDGVLTRCGWRVNGPTSADDVVWFGVCEKCRLPAERGDR